MRRKGLISKSDYDLRLDAPKSILETEKPQKPIFSGFLGGFFLVFLGGFLLPTLGQGEALAVPGARGEPRPPQDADGRERGLPGGAGAGRRPDAPGLRVARRVSRSQGRCAPLARHFFVLTIQDFLDP